MNGKEVYMATELTRLTFTVTEEMEAELRRFKKDLFYDKNTSEMIRQLVAAGIRAMKGKNEEPAQ